MRKLFLLCTAFLLVIAAGCGGDSPTASDAYTDSLTLGTGRYGLELTGETDTFTTSDDTMPTIYWRVESHEPLLTMKIELYVEKLTEFGYEDAFTSIFNSAQVHNYIAISSYYHFYGAGSFRATAFVGNEKRFIASVNFTVLEGT